MKRTSPRHAQQGIALITALLLVALATIAAVEMASRQHLDIRRVQNVLARDQALSYAVAAELWGLDILQSKMDGNPNTDHLGEDWAQPIVLPEFEGARLFMQIHDAQARFNLNNLANIDPATAQTNQYVAQFRRLLLVHGQVDAPADLEIANALMDWLDPDQDPRMPGGAEDGIYTLADPPYRSADALMASPSELRLVHGMTPEVYARIAPFITALPTPTPINVNTASAEVLMLIEGITPAAAEDAVKAREQLAQQEQPYTDVSNFLSQFPALPAAASQGLDVKSSYFELRSIVELGPARVRLRSLVGRGTGSATPPVTILARGQGPL
jgi:general secretion pathway protein K